MPRKLDNCLACGITSVGVRFAPDGEFCIRCVRDFEQAEAEARKELIAKMAGRLPEIDMHSPNIRRTLKVAAKEGRLAPSAAREIGVETGKHSCPVCGLRAWTFGEAEGCCQPGVREHERITAAARGGWSKWDGRRSPA